MPLLISPPPPMIVILCLSDLTELLSWVKEQKISPCVIEIWLYVTIKNFKVIVYITSIEELPCWSGPLVDHILCYCTLQVVHSTHLLMLQVWPIFGQFAESTKHNWIRRHQTTVDREIFVVKNFPFFPKTIKI